MRYPLLRFWAMVAWFLGAFSCLPAVGTAETRALLVGLNSYPFIKEPYAQLHGAATDLKQMRIVLEAAGAKVHELRGPAAASAAVRKSLGDIASVAREGDEVVFYFSGRGSVAPPAAGSGPDMEPALVVADGKPTSSAADIRMSVLEGWAREITAKKAVPVIILDTCYSRLGARGEDRYYKNVPRCIYRSGTPRSQLFRGPGVILAATGSQGSAYEWRVDFNTNTWAGAFTDELTNTAAALMKQSSKPTYRSLLEEVRKFFLARPGYMSGLRPYPAPPAITALYDRPFAGQGGAAAVVVAPEKTQSLQSLQTVSITKEKALRVGVEAEPGEARSAPTASVESAGRELQAYFDAHLPEVALVPRFGDRPDRILTVRREGTGWSVIVTGDEVDEKRNPTFRGAHLKAVMESGLSDYLVRQACVMRLFRMVRRGEGTLSSEWSIAPEQPRFRRGEVFRVRLQAPTNGWLYLLDQDEHDAVVQLVWPAPQDSMNLVSAGVSRLPKPEFEVDAATPLGRTLVCALFVEAGKGENLPALTPAAGGRWISTGGQIDPRYAKAERDHLRALLAAIDAGRLRWSARTFTYEVVE